MTGGSVARRWGDERGQGIAEVALVLPLFVVLLFAIFDVGRAVYTSSTLAEAAREGARLASVQARWVGKTGAACRAPVCPADTAALKSNVLAAVNRMTAGVGAIASAKVVLTCDDPDVAGSSTNCSGQRATGGFVRVHIDHDFSLVTPLIAQIANITQLSGASTMAIN